MNHYQTTTDKVLALIPLAAPEEQMIGGIHLPPNVSKKSLENNPLSQVLVHSVGPDCKTVKPGDSVVYNRHHISPITCEDGDLIILPEGQILAVVTKIAEKKPEPAPLPSAPEEPLTLGAIRAAIEASEKPGLPAEAPPVIAVIG